MLIFPIKKRWFDMMLSGEKQEEYREIKKYWDVRIIKWLGFPVSQIDMVKDLLRKKETEVTKEVIYQNGYGKNAPQAKAMCSLSIGTGKEEWGAVPGKEYYRFHIKEISRKE